MINYDMPDESDSYLQPDKTLPQVGPIAKYLDEVSTPLEQSSYAVFGSDRGIAWVVQGVSEPRDWP